MDVFFNAGALGTLRIGNEYFQLGGHDFDSLAWTLKMRHVQQTIRSYYPTM
jgi:hypothetical protein